MKSPAAISMLPNSNLKGILIGRWHIKRTILHSESKELLFSAQGEAKWEYAENVKSRGVESSHSDDELNLKENSFEYIELGKLYKDNSAISEFQRRYLYTFNVEKPFHATVWFYDQDGIRFFHDLHFTLKENIPQASDDTNLYPLQTHATHLCKSDTYNCHFVIASRDTLNVEYDIRGPKKSLLIRTSFHRLES